MATDLDRDDAGGTMSATRPGEVTVSPSADPAPDSGRRVAVVASAVVVAVVVLVGAILVVRSGEEPAPEPPPTAGPSEPAPNPPGSSSPPGEEPPTAEAAAIAAAETVYGEYLQVFAEVAANGGADAAAFETVAVGDALSQAQVTTENYRLAGITQVGRPEIASLEPQSVELGTGGGAAVPEVVLDACLDVTGFDLVQDGQSVLDPNAPERVASVVTVREYPERGGWLVASVAAEGARC
jgi:hypothetical protein